MVASEITGIRTIRTDNGISFSRSSVAFPALSRTTSLNDTLMTDPVFSVKFKKLPGISNEDKRTIIKRQTD
jgi:hypothetical protein